METINGILKEMRDADGIDSSGWFTQKHVLDWANRIDAAAKRQTMLCHCHSACSCDLLAKMENENAKLNAALKPVLDIAADGVTSDLAMAETIDEAKRIYKEGAIK